MQSVIAFEVAGVHRAPREAGVQLQGFMPAVAYVVWYFLGYVCSRIF